MFPAQDKVTFLSRQSNEINIDYKLLINALKQEKEPIRIVTLCKTIDSGLFNRVGYLFYTLKCMYHIATSKVCIVDGYSIPISILKHKKELMIIQMWHALGAIKKFGLQCVDKKEGINQNIAQLMDMHKNYNYILCPSKATKKFYEEAFGVDDSRIMLCGMPRVDYLLNANTCEVKDKFRVEYPEIVKKPIILYAPTFRKGRAVAINPLVDAIDLHSYSLIVKTHPLDYSVIDSKYIVDQKYSIFDLIQIADYIITDYSSIALEASLLKKPVYFYVYDIDDYVNNRGLNVQVYNELKHQTRTDAAEIVQLIEQNYYDYDALERFKNKYIEVTNQNNTKYLSKFIISHMFAEEQEDIV